MLALYGERVEEVIQLIEYAHQLGYNNLGELLKFLKKEYPICAT